MKEKSRVRHLQFVQVYEILIKFKENLTENCGILSLKHGNQAENSS